jgi:hypothetical protein
MSVFWTIRARRHLRQALAELLGRESREAEAEAEDGRVKGPGVQEQTMDRIAKILANTFKDVPVVVKDQVIGYRRKKDRFILLIEAFGDDASGRSGPYVVKIGPRKEILKEVRGWECCRPPGLRHDLVFLELCQGESDQGDPEPWMSLVYGDAQQFLGVEITVTFEQAALEAIRSGFPRIASVGFVVVELFERIGHLLYSQAYVDDPARPGFEFDLPKLDRCMGLWETDPPCLEARCVVNTDAVSGIGQFLDPIDYLRYVQKFVTWSRDIETGSDRPEKPEKPEVPEVPGLPLPKVVDLIPRMLRGCSHGDLHGRNILVGIVRERAMWPTVFDYEDMGACNLVGWDFVKLETELKVRAYLDVFGGGSASKFIRSVQRFEVDLGLETEKHHRDRSWPEVGDPSTPEDRLRAVLLMIRRMAAQHLGSNHGRPNSWLEEYYFLLACYGVSTGRFANLQRRERISALVSAGVATARLTWPRKAW